VCVCLWLGITIRLCYLKNGYNVVFFGMGSKKRLLEDFCSKHLRQSHKIVYFGYSPVGSVYDLLFTITQQVLGRKGENSFRTSYEQLSYIRSRSD